MGIGWHLVWDNTRFSHHGKVDVLTIDILNKIINGSDSGLVTC
jgi:hypothetical protein